ncbi:tetraacyldisaccharide 4'-kinase [Desulfosarcina ovata subsp. ovata]|uniref:Tetraacyldisaccharide 4'-kinase n=2 Tax=Desulfosarcina ovata TaxID=83564 RepID=A0A5K8A5Q5_9BACT|nr:tetraacyldisaccharide 4'-kinase [Desulfosarcina ovata subsp. ovata]
MAVSKKKIEKIRHRIKAVMQNPARSPRFSLETFLLVLSMVYGAGMRLRARLYEIGWLPSRTLPCRVISIGNICVGGTGKTPMTIFVARTIRNLGYRVVVVSRGYHGRMETTGGIVSDGQSLLATVDDAGDEPYLMARVLKGVPVIVGSRRYQAGLLAVRRFDPEVIVLDDAFQHLALKRDLDLVLLDHQLPLGNGRMLPRGTLREPPTALRRAHALVFTRSREHGPRKRSIFPWTPRRPVFYTTHTPVIRTDGASRAREPFLTRVTDLSLLKGRKVFAFAGLADNEQFFATLEAHGCEMICRRSFNDHHYYGDQEIDALLETAQASGADSVVTTLKDYVKLAHRGPWPVAWIAVDVEINFLGKGADFRQLLRETLRLPE